MLESGAGLLRKAEVDAHRKVAMQVPQPKMLLSRATYVVSPYHRQQHASSVGSEQQAAAPYQDNITWQCMTEVLDTCRVAQPT